MSIDTTTSAKRERQARRRRTFLARSAVIAILGPSLLYALYLLVLAPPQYEATTSFAVRGTHANSQDVLGAVGILAPTVATTDARIVEDYIRSPAMVGALRERYRFNDAYSRFNLDPMFSQLSPRASLESATGFWNRKVDVRFDAATSASTVTVRASTPQDALRLSRGVLTLGEELVNGLAERAMRDLSSAATAEIERKSQELQVARERLAEFQGRRSAIDINAPAQQAIALVGSLDAQLATKRTEMAAASQIYQPNSPQMQAFRREIGALETERQRAVSNALEAPGEAVVGGDIEARAMLLDYEVAQQAYQQAVGAAESARRQEATDRKYLVAYVPPELPQKSDYWPRLWNVLALLIACALLWGVAALIYSIIRDHME